MERSDPAIALIAAFEEQEKDLQRFHQESYKEDIELARTALDEKMRL